MGLLRRTSVPGLRYGALLAVLLAPPALVHADDPMIGSVKTLQGRATIIRGAQSLAVTEGMHLFAKDLIRTESDGIVGFILRDGTRISLGPQTELGIDRFLYEPADKKLGLLLNLVRGIAIYVSGKIAQFSPESVEVRTPVGLIGLRGTEFAVKLEQP